MVALLTTDEQWVTATYEPSDPTDTKPITIQWNSRIYQLNPNSPRPIPMSAAHLWFGDPRATMGGPTVIRDPENPNNTTIITSREDEIRRLRLKWGIHSGAEMEFEAADGFTPPVVIIRDLESDTTIPTVVQDPTGLGPVTSSPLDDETLSAHSKLLAQAEHIRVLEEKLAASDDLDASSVPVDDADGRSTQGLTKSQPKAGPTFFVPTDNTPGDEEKTLYAGELDDDSNGA